CPRRQAPLRKAEPRHRRVLGVDRVVRRGRHGSVAGAGMKILEPQRLRKVEWWEYAERFLFGCVISAGAAIAGEVLGSRVAGALLAFPAILPASLTLTNKKEGHSAAAQQDVGALFGGVGLVAFAL